MDILRTVVKRSIHARSEGEAGLTEIVSLAARQGSPPAAHRLLQWADTLIDMLARLGTTVRLTVKDRPAA